MYDLSYALESRTHRDIHRLWTVVHGLFCVFHIKILNMKIGVEENGFNQAIIFIFIFIPHSSKNSLEHRT